MAEKLSLFLFHDLRFAIYDFRKSQIANQNVQFQRKTF